MKKPGFTKVEDSELYDELHQRHDAYFRKRISPACHRDLRRAVVNGEAGQGVTRRISILAIGVISSPEKSRALNL